VPPFWFDPAFGLTNYARDVIGAALTVGAEDGAKSSAKIVKDAARSIAAVREVEFGKKEPKS